MKKKVSIKIIGIAIVLFFPILFSSNLYADYQTSLVFQGYIQDGLSDLDISSYSVPFVYDWDSDGKKDLLVGQNNGSNGYVSFYENLGTNDSPAFNGSTYIQACDGTCTLNVAGSGRQGSYQTVVDWNNDNKHDLLVGDGSGGVTIFLNTKNNSEPILDSGTTIFSGGTYSAPIVDDWNGDGAKDLLIGHLDGKIQIYLNEGTDAAPSYSAFSYLQMGGTDFDIGSTSAPRIYDWNNDGYKDLLVGDSQGYISFLENTGTNNAPTFNSAKNFVLFNGNPLKFDYANNPTADTRSRLFVTDWNEDGLDDIIVGGSNGKLELYTSVVPEPISSTLFVIGAATMGFRIHRKKKIIHS